MCRLSLLWDARSQLIKRNLDITKSSGACDNLTWQRWLNDEVRHDRNSCWICDRGFIYNFSSHISGSMPLALCIVPWACDRLTSCDKHFSRFLFLATLPRCHQCSWKASPLWSATTRPFWRSQSNLSFGDSRAELLVVKQTRKMQRTTW